MNNRHLIFYYIIIGYLILFQYLLSNLSWIIQVLLVMNYLLLAHQNLSLNSWFWLFQYSSSNSLTVSFNTLVLRSLSWWIVSIGSFWLRWTCIAYLILRFQQVLHEDFLLIYFLINILLVNIVLLICLILQSHFFNSCVCWFTYLNALIYILIIFKINIFSSYLSRLLLLNLFLSTFKTSCK